MALTKDPDAVLDYTFDWSAWLADGETIASHDVAVEAGDVVVDSTTATDDIVVVWVSGGTLDTLSEIRCRVETSDGRIDDRTISIIVRETFADVGCEEWPIIGFDGTGVDPEVMEAATNAAQQFLRGLTMGRFGTCTYAQRFQIRATRSGVCTAPTASGNCCAIKLSHTPVQSILGVKVDGVLLDPSAYQMLGGARLGRTSGCWPQSGDCEPGRVQVWYKAGVSLKAGSKWHGLAGAAMGEMTGEYVNGLTGKNCKLPSRFVSIARQGVTTQALDPALFLNLGLTGLPFTDNLRRTANPTGMRRKPRVVSIDGPRTN